MTSGTGDVESAESAGRPRRRPGWRGLLQRSSRYLRVALLLAIVGFAGYALATNWQEVRASLGDMGWGRSLAAGVLLAVATGGQFMGWRRCLDALGSSRIPVGAGAAIFATSQAAKYMPGSVWPVVVQADMGRRFHVPRRVMLASYAYILLQSLAAAGVLAGLTLTGPRAGWTGAITVLALLGGVGLTAALQAPGLFHRMLDIPFRRFTGRGMPAGIRRAPLNRGLLWVVFSWFVGGIATWLLVEPLGIGPGDAPFVVGASALAWVVGLVVVVVPAGAGVRELVLVLTLGQLVGTTEALTVAVVSRFLQIIVDLGLAVALGLPYYLRMRGGSSAE